jgi:hypothetical protein
VSKEGDAYHALVRAPSANGLDYQVWALQAREAVTITDILLYTSGEWFSDAFRRITLAILGNDNAPQLAQQAALYERLTKAIQEKLYPLALEVLRRLPPETRVQRGPLTTRLRCAMEVGPEEVEAAVADFQKALPADPSLDLLLMEYYCKKNELDKALAASEQLDKKVNDPYLEVVRLGVYRHAKRDGEAKLAAQRALARDPGLQDPYWELLRHAALEKDYAGAVKLLEELDARCDLDLAEMTNKAVLAALVSSTEYQAWLKRREGER